MSDDETPNYHCKPDREAGSVAPPPMVRLDPELIYSCNAERWLLRNGSEWVCYLISIDPDETATFVTWQGIVAVNVPAATAKDGVESYLREGWVLIDPRDRITESSP